MADFTFVNENGIPAKGNDAIFPIMKVVEGKWHPIGTGFFIATNGIFLTAWHVLQDALDENGRMNCDGIAAFHMLPDSIYIIRPILRSCHHVRSDLAVGAMAKATHNTTGKLLANKVMKLTLKPQEIGNEIVTWAYPKTVAGFENSKQTIRFSPDFYSGAIEEHFPDQRDNYLLPFPCYRGNIRIMGGASGGPVVNLDDGRVFGINCTGIKNTGGENVSHYTSLSVIGELWIDDVSIDGEQHDHILMSELITRGIIDCD